MSDPFSQALGALNLSVSRALDGFEAESRKRIEAFKRKVDVPPVRPPKPVIGVPQQPRVRHPTNPARQIRPTEYPASPDVADAPKTTRRRWAIGALLFVVLFIVGVVAAGIVFGDEIFGSLVLEYVSGIQYFDSSCLRIDLR